MSGQNQLEIVLEKATKDRHFQHDFFTRLCTAEIFAILASDLPEATTTLHKGASVALEQAELNGKVYVPVFTSLEHLKNFAKREVRYIGANGLDLFKMIAPQHDALLNPGAPFGKIFTREEMLAIAAGKYSYAQEEAKPASLLSKLLGRKKA